MTAPGGTRAEHLEWCRGRALEYLGRGDLLNAAASMGSDLSKHPETRQPAVILLLGVAYARDGDAASLRRWIEGIL